MGAPAAIPPRGLRSPSAAPLVAAVLGPPGRDRRVMPRLAAVVGGAALYALALPPFGFSSLAWVALVPLLLAVRDGSVRRGLAYGVLYGVVLGWTMLWWLAQAAAHYLGIGLPLAAVALTLCYVVWATPTFGLFGAGAAALLRRGTSRTTRLAVPALFVASELVRDRVAGQPWGLIGYTQHAHTGLIQIAALGGVYAVSFLLVLGNTAIAEAIDVWWRRRRLAEAAARLVAPGGVIAVCWLGGTVLAALGPIGGFGGHTVAIVQSNVPPAFEWTPVYVQRQTMAHVRATEALPSQPNPSLIVWPEHAVPQYLDADPGLAAELTELATRRRADLLFGAPRYEAGRTYNSAQIITAAGHDGGHYDKQHLVLFAEEKPLARTEAAAPDENPTAFSAGTQPGVLQSFVRLGVSICHEIVYPELIDRSVGAGAELLVNISNDGWLDPGYGFASRQHFAMAVFRATETRRYLVRAATTGVSGVIDPYGRVVETLPAQRAGVLMAGVAGRRTLTPYVRLGDAFAFACAAAAAAALVARRRQAPWRRPALAPVPLPT